MAYDGVVLLLIILGAVFSAAQSASLPTQAIVPLYLTNTVLDSYGPRQGSNTAYFGVFDVGTPPKQFTGCFDTGSADAWLPLSTCRSMSCLTHDSYNPNASSTYQASTTQFSIQYATGSVIGNLARDVFSLGGVAIQSQGFGAVSVAGSELMQSSCDGIFGFAFPKISQLRSTPPFFTMVNQSLLSENTFSFWLSTDPTQEPAGELMVGGVNPQRMTGPTTFVAVPNNTYWAVPLDGAGVDGQDVSLTATAAIIDTGSTAITVGSVDGQTLHELIPGASYWADMGVYNISGGCSNISALPSVSFTIDGISYALPPSLWVIKFQGTCVSGFIPSGRGTQLVLGVTFLRAWHTQYTYNPVTQTAQIGLSQPTAAGTLAAAATQPISFAGRRLLSPDEAKALPKALPHRQHIFSATIPTAAERGLTIT